MCTWNTLILADLMFLQGGGTCGVGGVSIKYVQSNNFSEDVFLEYCQIGRFNAFTGWRNIKMCDLQSGGTCG